MVAQGIVNQFARSGRIDASIETVKAALRERSTVLCDALERELPDARFVAAARVATSCGSSSRGEPTSARWPRRPRERGVQFVKGTDFVLEGGESSLRLAYSGVTSEEIEEGVARLADAYRAVTAGAGAGVG